MYSLFVRFDARLNASRAPKRPRAGPNTLQQRRGASPRSGLFRSNSGTRSLLTSVPAGDVPRARRSDLDHPDLLWSFRYAASPYDDTQQNVRARSCRLPSANTESLSTPLPRAGATPWTGTASDMLPRKGWPLPQGFIDFDKAQREPDEESVTPPRKRKADEYCVIRCAVPPSATSPDAPRFTNRSAHVARGVPLLPGFTVRRPAPISTVLLSRPRASTLTASRCAGHS